MKHDEKQHDLWFVCSKKKNRKHNIVNEKLQALTSNFSHTSFPVHFKVLKLERMVEVPGNVVILEHENELLEKMMMMTTMKNHQKAVKKYTPCTSTHMHIHIAPNKHTWWKRKEKKVVRTVHHQLTHAHHICTKHTCLKRKKRVVKECFFFVLGEWLNHDLP